jgi:hypothetical protein
VSVTEYLTDHNGNKVAFFYYIESERFRTCPQLVWKCRDYPTFNGTCSSKAEFIECAKQVLKELKKVPVCKDCGLTSPKMEAQSTCPQCLIENK